jgi:hypothetical protein
MSTQFTRPGRTVSAGDLVIPISEIFDRLQSTVGQSTLDQLLQDIISGRRNQVRPGELITAELMNQILAQLESLEARVTRLEAGGDTTPGDAAPVITRLVPPETETMRVNQTIEVFGRNFAFTTGSLRLTIDGIPVTSFDTSASNNEHLVFSIPPLPSLPQTGRVVDLVARVGTQSAQRRINVLPLVTTQRGRVSPSFVSVDPVRITPGATTPVTFRYNLVAATLFPATFFVRPIVTGIANQGEWQNRLVVLNRQGQQIPSRQISMGPSEETIFFLQLTSVPPSPAGQTTGNITLTAEVTAENVETGTDSRTFPLGETIEEDTSIELPSPPLAEPTAALSGTTVRLGPNTGVNISLGLRFTQLINATGGDEYTLSAAILEGNDWSAGIAPGFSDVIVVRTAGEQASADFTVRTGANPSATGRVEFRLQRKGAGSKRRTFQFILNRV